MYMYVPVGSKIYSICSRGGKRFESLFVYRAFEDFITLNIGIAKISQRTYW